METSILCFLEPGYDIQFGDLAHKITDTVSWFRPQNQVGGGLSVCASKPMRG
jgi:hypothetical protein